MKKIIFIFVMTALILVCAGAEGIREKSAAQEARTLLDFSEITGQQWNLIEVHIDGSNTQFRRSSLPNEPKNLFTINLDGNSVSGAGAPNRYSAPYTTGDSQTIRIMMMRSTRMASLFETENLKEHDYFTYIQNSYSWNIIGGQMELYSKSENGREVRLVFSF